MQFLKKDGVGKATTKARGDAGEDEALAYLQERGLRLLQRNYRTPGRGGGEIDLIMQAPEGTVLVSEKRGRLERQGHGHAPIIAKTAAPRECFANGPALG